MPAKTQCPFCKTYGVALDRDPLPGEEKGDISHLTCSVCAIHMMVKEDEINRDELEKGIISQDTYKELYDELRQHAREAVDEKNFEWNESTDDKKVKKKIVEQSELYRNVLSELTVEKGDGRGGRK